MTTSPSELTRTSDALAAAVANLLPHGHDPLLIVAFKKALGDLLAATLGGATVMAAGAVVALDNKVERLAQVRGERLRQLQLDVDQLSTRIHSLEDEFLDDGTVGQLSTSVATIALEVEALKARQVGDGAAE